MTDPATTESELDRNEPKLNRKPRGLRLRGALVWQPIQDGWRQVYGGFDDLGVSFEWHNFELSKPFECSRSLRLPIRLLADAMHFGNDRIVNAIGFSRGRRRFHRFAVA